MKFWKIIKKAIVTFLVGMMFLLTMATIEVTSEAYRIYMQYDVNIEDCINTAVYHWQGRVDELQRKIDEWSNKIAEERRQKREGWTVSYPMCNSNISWNTLVRP